MNILASIETHLNTVILAAGKWGTPDISNIKSFTGEWGGWWLTIIALISTIAFAISCAWTGIKFYGAKSPEKRAELKDKFVGMIIGLVISISGTAILALVSGFVGN